MKKVKLKTKRHKKREAGEGEEEKKYKQMCPQRASRNVYQYACSAMIHSDSSERGETPLNTHGVEILLLLLLHLCFSASASSQPLAAVLSHI